MRTNRAQQAECVVSGPLAVVLRCSRLFGLAPLQFCQHDRGWKIQISSTYTICGHVVVTVINVVIMYILVVGIQLSLKINSRPIEVVAYTVEALIVMITASTMVYTARAHMQCVLDTCNRADQITAQVKIHPWPETYSRRIIAVFLFWIAISLIATFFDTFAPLFTGDNITTYTKVCIVVKRCLKYYFDWIIQLGIYQFSFLVLHLKTYFIAINESITHLLINDFKDKQQKEGPVLLGDNEQLNNKFRAINKIVDSMNGSKTEDTDDKRAPPTSAVTQDMVRRLFSAYVSACGALSSIDRGHGLTVMLVLAVTFVRLIFKPYYFIDSIFKDNVTGPIGIYNKSSNLYWSVFHLINLVTIVEPCHLTHVEMMRTRELVSQVSRRVDLVLDPLAVELEQFCKYLHLNQITYRPMNFTTISRRLILAILGNIMTYLVVIVEIK